MVTFCKSANCPSAQKLLAFQNGDAAERDAYTIRRHLAGCEFCAAEAEFYAHYPQSEETVSEVVVIGGAFRANILSEAGKLPVIGGGSITDAAPEKIIEAFPNVRVVNIALDARKQSKTVDYLKKLKSSNLKAKVLRFDDFEQIRTFFAGA